MAYSSAKPRSRRSGIPGWPSAPAPRGPGEGVAAEDARRSERLTGSRRVRRPQPGNAGVEGRASDRPTDWRTPPWHHPQRTPARKPGSGALIESTIGLRIVNLAKHQVPRALAEPAPSARQPPPDACQDENRAPERYPSRAARSRGEESPILSSRGQKKRFFADSGPKRTILRTIGSPYANNRQKRPSPTSETAKNRQF